MAEHQVRFYAEDPTSIFSNGIGSTFNWTGSDHPVGRATITDNEAGSGGQTLDDDSAGAETATATVTIDGVTSTASNVDAEIAWTIRDTVTNQVFQVVRFEVENGDASGFYTLSEIPLVAGRNYEVVDYVSNPDISTGDPVFTYADYEGVENNVSGTSGDDTIDASYSGDPEGDRVDDGFGGGADGNDNVIEGFAGDDSISSGAGDDEVYGGLDDDTVEGGVGDDTIYGDTAGPGGGGAPEFLDWSAQGSDESSLASGFTQNTGGMDVSVSFVSDGNNNPSYSVETSTTTYVGSGEPFDPRSSAQLSGSGGGATSTTTIGFAAASGSGLTDAVQNVAFRINDIDMGEESYRDVVTVNAYDAQGNPVTVTLTPAGNEIVSGNTITAGGDPDDGSTDAPSSAGGSVLVEIDGPVSQVEVIFSNAGSGSQSIYVSDVHFDTIIENPTGDDSLSGGAGDDVIYGEAGADTIEGEEGNDSLYGGTGDDLISGGSGADYIEGGDGADTVSGGSGDDVIQTGGGSDLITGDEGADWISAGDGMDTIDYSGSDSGVNVNLPSGSGSGGHAEGDTLYGVDAVTGSSFDDTIIGYDTEGTPGANYFTNDLRGGAGDDFIDGRGGSDTLDGGSGSDTIEGGDGDDFIRGGYGDDTLEGGAGNDTLMGSDGTDAVQTILSYDFDDTTGLTQYQDATFDTNDTLGSPSGTSALVFTSDGTFNAGNYGGVMLDVPTENLVVGETYKLSFWVRTNGPDSELQISYQSGSGGPHTFVTTSADATSEWQYVEVTGTLDEVHDKLFIWGEDPNTTYAVDALRFEQVSPDQDADSISGGDGDDVVYASDGDDTIDGGAGSDTISGDAGADSITGGAGDDDLRGGEGDDTFAFSDGFGSDTVTGGDGSDTLDFSDLSSSISMNWTAVSAGADQVLFSEIEKVIGTVSGDVVTFSGYTQAVTIEAGGGADTLVGSLAGDTVLGEAGNDLLLSHGDGAGDLWDGGEGNDTIYFYDGFGSDTLVGGAGTDRVTLSNLGEGVTVNFTAPLAGTITTTGDSITFSEVEIFDLTNQADVVYGGSTFLNLYAGGGDDTIFGSSSSDGIQAGTGDDSITGEAGNDYLRGAEGSDTIDGGTGGDWLDGGTGDDTITGGTGNDTFIIGRGGGSDVITDFDLGDDDGDGATNDQLNISGLRTPSGDPVTLSDVVVSDDGFGNAVLTFPEGESVVLQGVAPSQVTWGQMSAMGVPCFTEGTRIRTPKGDVPVEALKVGDLVVTADHGAQPIRYLSTRRLGGDRIPENKLPILISAGSLGPGLPARDLAVSGQHRMLLSWREVRHTIGVDEVLAPAKALVHLRGIRLKKGARAVAYTHLLFDRHEVIFAEGSPTESFYPGATILRDMGNAARAGLFEAMPALRHGAAVALGDPARRLLRVQETLRLVQARKSRINVENSKFSCDLAGKKAGLRPCLLSGKSAAA